jgi:hypothetical protein
MYNLFMEGNYSKLLDTKTRIDHRGVDQRVNIANENTKIGDDAHLGHIFEHVFNSYDGAPLPDIYPITREQMAIVLQSLKYNFESSRFGDKREPNYERSHGFVNYNEFYLIIYLIMHSKEDNEIIKIIKNWRIKIHKNNYIAKIKHEDLKDFDSEGYDRWFKGLYIGVEEFTGKTISEISDWEYLQYARLVVENMDKYKNIKKLGEELRQIKTEYISQHLFNKDHKYTPDELNLRINKLLETYKDIPLETIQEVFDINFTQYNLTKGEIANLRKQILENI